MRTGFIPLEDPSNWEGLIRVLALPSEDVDDILAGLTILGQRRARLLNRPLDMVQDLGFGLSFLCWQPWKPTPLAGNQAYLMNNRGELFRGASNDPNVEERFKEAIPDEFLTMDLSQLYQVLQTEDIRNYIRLEGTGMTRANA